MFFQYSCDFVTSSLIHRSVWCRAHNLQSGLTIMVDRLYVSTALEQKAHYLQRPICRRVVQRG